MKKKIILLLIAIWLINYVHAEEKHFTKKRFSMYEGFRNISMSPRPLNENLDFLNYVNTSETNSVYQYFEVAFKIWSRENYQLDTRVALYNDLIPYCFNVTFNYQLNPIVGIEAGTMATRLYLNEFNGFYANVFDQNFDTRFINRQWNFSIGSLFIGPSFQMKYKWLSAEAALKGGVSSYFPFHQKNIIKELHTNYKKVLEYQTSLSPAVFVMPEIEVFIDFFQYSKIAVGGRFKFSHFYTRNAIKYTLTNYEWTYETPVVKKINSPKHSYQQTDWDVGLYLRW